MNEAGGPTSSNKPRQVAVLLPDMFRCFLRQDPPINPHYAAVKAQSEEWLSSFCSFDSKMKMRINKCDFSYFCAIAAPNAPLAKFRTLCDWGNWVFPYDDMFDNGYLCGQVEESQRVMESLMMPMVGQSCATESRLRIVEAHDTVVERVFASTSEGVQNRFTRAMQGYCRGVLQQVDDNSCKRFPSLEEIVTIRRESAGCRPLFHLVEYAHDLQVPDEIFDDPVIQELECLGVDMVAISNDMLSYQKEQAEGVPHNMIAICRLSGMSAQQAFNAMGGLLEARYRRWEEAEREVRSWGEKADAEVQMYIDGIKAVVKANLYWSFESDRYLRPSGDEVRRTRTIQLLAD